MKVLVLNPPTDIKEVLPFLPDNSTLVKGYYQNVEIIFARTDMAILIKGVDLRTFDYVWISASWSKRAIACVLSLYLTHHNRPHTTVEEGLGSTKLVDMAHYAIHGIPQPRSYFCTSKLYKKHRQNIITTCGFPMIVKDVRGTRGKKCFLARDEKELRKGLRADKKRTDFVFQEYIENDYDWGVIVGNNEVLSAERSYRDLESTAFMNHAYLGATEVFEEIEKIPEDVVAMALKANNILHLDWGRSDIIHNKKDNKPYILETNRSPRMTSNSPEVKAFGKFLSTVLKKSKTPKSRLQKSL